MKVVMVTNNALEDKIGGHERYVRELASTLSRRGLEVTIAAKRWRRDSPQRERCVDGVVIERYDVPSKQNPLYAALYPAYVAGGVRVRARRSNPRTVVHAHMGLPALPLTADRQPYVFTFHAPVWRELLSERQGSYALPRAIQSTAVRMLKRAESRVARRAKTRMSMPAFRKCTEPSAKTALAPPG